MFHEDTAQLSTCAENFRNTFYSIIAIFKYDCSKQILRNIKYLI